MSRTALLVIDMINDYRHDDAEALAESALAGERPDLVEPILPQPGCRIVTTVRHNVSYATALDYLLGRLEARRLVLAGQVTEQCILYSALDGYVRHYDVVVPPDAVAHIDAELGAAALAMMNATRVPNCCRRTGVYSVTSSIACR